jgi:RNA polymerase sigma factor (sigma-70 family)
VSTVTQILDSIAEEVARADRTDGQLLDLFVRLRDEDAFAAVVRRHGPMVLGVCRRVLRNAADADDAFQAAFLVLARKAATISTRHLLSQWLYGVAYNTARKLRQSNTRRAAREHPLTEGVEPLANAPEPRDELLRILDEELNQLPERYRAVIVLCDLDGLTRREAAQMLSCPEGTVGGRLARARALLAERLTRRGVTAAAGLLVAVLTERAAVAVPLDGVMRAVGADDLARAAAQGLISARVAHTTEGVLKGMFATKLRTIAATVLCCGLALACGFGAIHFANAQPKTDPKPKTALDPFAGKPAPEKAKPAEAEKRVFTVIPLKKLEAAPTIARLWTLFPKTVTVAAVRDENSLIVYATAKETDDVRLVLRTLGEEVPKDDPKPAEEVMGPKPKAKTYAFRMKNVPWADVLDWYAKESGLTMITTVKPTGTFTFEPPAGRAYALAEVTDFLNEALVPQKMILIRRERTFTLHPADEKLDPSAWRRVELKELPELGRTELVEVQLTTEHLDAGDVRDELRKLLTPFGEITFAKGNTFVVRDTVGNILRIRATLEPIDKPAERPVYVDPIDPRKPVAPKTYAVRFDKVPWKDVFAWYAKETGLTRVGDALPTGTFSFNLPPPNVLEVLSPLYTLDEITDHINDALLKQKWLLVRDAKSFAVIPADEKVDTKWVRSVTIEELRNCRRTELVRVVVPLALSGPDLRPLIPATDVVPTVRRILGPFGRAERHYYTGSRDEELLVQDTVGNIPKIVKAIRDLEEAEVKKRAKEQK